MTDGRSYYAVPFRLDGKRQAFIWFSDDADGAVRDPSGGVLVFDDVDDVAPHCAAAGMDLKDQPVPLYDFDLLQHWLSQGDNDVDCEMILNMWNMLGDIAASIDGGSEVFQLGDRNGLDLHEKVFSGTSAADVAFTVGRQNPEWDESEIERLKSILRAGLRVTRAALGDGES